MLLVEGASDKLAVESLAVRRGRNLADEGIDVVAMGGATNIGHYLDQYGPTGSDAALAGLFDIAEAPYLSRGLTQVGLGSGPGRAEMEALGFFACDADLEDELIRALGVPAVEDFVDEQGELGSFRTLQKQPAQRGRPITRQLHRFIGVKSGRKSRYAVGLVNLLDLPKVPRPLDRALAHL